jgi:hypothetical protein
MAMNLRRELADVKAHLSCRRHPTQVLVCSQCDMLELPPEEWAELAELLDKAGYLDRDPYEGQGSCWRCGQGMACLACLDDREEPPGMSLMSDTEIDRLYELGGKLVPPWLT